MDILWRKTIFHLWLAVGHFTQPACQRRKKEAQGNINIIQVILKKYQFTERERL